MNTFVGLIVVALVAWVIIAAVSAADRPKPPLPPPPGPPQVPPPYWQPMPPTHPAAPLSPPQADPGFEILSRTDLPPAGAWTQPDPGGFEPQPVGDFGNFTINLNAICYLTGSVVRDCRCDQHRNLKG